MTATKQTEDLAHAVAVIQVIAEKTEEMHQFSVPTVIDGLLAVAMGLALALFGPEVTVARLRQVADRVAAGEQAGPTFTTKH